MPFNIGDEIEVNIPGRFYFTDLGSVGEVIDIDSKQFRVKFHTLSGKKLSYPEEFGFYINEHSKYFSLVSSSNKVEGKYAHVINKIRRMEKKRKEQGYAY